MIVYKVASINEKSRKPETLYRSSIAYRFGMGLRYGIGVTTYPRYGSPIFAFVNEGDAMAFALADGSPNNPLTILECEAEPYGRKFNIGPEWPGQPNRLPMCTSFEKSFVKKFWKDPEAIGNMSSAPYGTVFCAWVKPTRALSTVEFVRPGVR